MLACLQQLLAAVMLHLLLLLFFLFCWSSLIILLVLVESNAQRLRIITTVLDEIVKSLFLFATLSSSFGRLGLAYDLQGARYQLCWDV